MREATTADLFAHQIALDILDVHFRVRPPTVADVLWRTELPADLPKAELVERLVERHVVGEDGSPLIAPGAERRPLDGFIAMQLAEFVASLYESGRRPP